MAILKIARMGHPILRRSAAAVADVADAHIQRLIDDMIETMHDADGAGLAAPQVHAGVRVVIFHVPAGRADGEEGEGEDQDEDGPVGLTVLVNPVIVALSDEIAVGPEACLSVPGMVGLVPRHTHIRYGGLDREGHAFEREARGFHARVVQHECDHLDGVLYPMRMRDLSTLAFTSEIRARADD